MSTIAPDPAAPARSSAAGSGSATSSSGESRRSPPSASPRSSCFLTYKIFALAWPAMQKYGLSFIWTQAWNPNTNVYGALVFIYGTIVTSFIALLLATPLSIAIALFLTELAPRRLGVPDRDHGRAPGGDPERRARALGHPRLRPVDREPPRAVAPELVRLPADLLRRPVAGGDAAGGARPDDHDHPDHLGDLPGAVQPRAARSLRRVAALGSTRWEAIRKVAIPYAAPGISAAVLLGLGRAFGEAIAVTQVIGGGNSINRSLFPPADTLASRIASTYRGASSDLEVQSLALPRRDPARDLADHERVGAADREQVPEGAEDVDRMSTAEIIDPYDITSKSNNLGRRRRRRSSSSRSSPS